MAKPQAENGYTKIANELFDAYLQASKHLSPYENAVWLCVVRKTYGYNKTQDWLSLSQISKITNIASQHIARTIKKLKEKKMITTTTTPGKTSQIAIQKDYEGWELLPKQVVLPKQVTTTTQMGMSTTTQTGNHKRNSILYNITKDNIQKKEPTNVGKVIPPTLQQVEDYIKEKYPNLIAEAERFWNFYGSKGWMVGKNKMRDWHCSVGNWMIGKEQKAGYSGDTGTHKVTDKTRPAFWDNV